MSKPIEYRVVVASRGRDARDLLVEESGLSASRISDAMTAGAVWLRNAHGIRRIRRRSAAITEGDELFLNYDESVLAQSAADAELIRDAGRWSAWFKPAGMRSQGSRWGDHTTLGRFAEHNLVPQRESFIVHRLDLAAKGLMLLAHDKKAAASLSKQFAERSVIKRYHAIVHGKFPGGTRHQEYSDDIDGKSALSRAVRLRFDPEMNYSVLLVTIETGRKHQIRKHLANAGFPIVGDRLHGQSVADRDMCLCASYLAFSDPDTGTRVKIERPPDDWL